MRKFAFDVEFAADGEVLSAGTALPRRFTEAELEAAKAEAYARGKDDAYAAAERAAAKALQDIGAHTRKLIATLEDERRALRAEAARASFAAAEKIAGAALSAFGEARALQAIEAALENLRSGPRLIVRLSPALADSLKPRIEKMRAEIGYEGAVLVRADETMSAAAVSLDWADGMVSIDPTAISARIGALVEAALASAEAGDEA